MNTPWSQGQVDGISNYCIFRPLLTLESCSMFWEPVNWTDQNYIDWTQNWCIPFRRKALGLNSHHRGLWQLEHTLDVCQHLFLFLSPSVVWKYPQTWALPWGVNSFFFSESSPKQGRNILHPTAIESCWVVDRQRSMSKKHLAYHWSRERHSLRSISLVVDKDTKEAYMEHWPWLWQLTRLMTTALQFLTYSRFEEALKWLQKELRLGEVHAGFAKW